MFCSRTGITRYSTVVNTLHTLPLSELSFLLSNTTLLSRALRTPQTCSIISQQFCLMDGGCLSKKAWCFTPTQPVRLHQANYQRKLDVSRPLNQYGYIRRPIKEDDVLRPINQYDYITRTIKEILMVYAQYGYIRRTIKEDDVSRPVNQFGYFRRTNKEVDILRPVNQYGYIRRTIKENLMVYAQ